MGGGTPIPNRLDSKLADPNLAAPGLAGAGPEQRLAEFERLERAVVALAGRHEQALRENEKLRRQVEDRDRRIRALESEAIELNQRRRDVAKRIDDLLAQIDQSDPQVVAARD